MNLNERIAFVRREILNWDHDVCGTPAADMAQNIARAITLRNVSLKDQLSFEVKGDKLEVFVTKPAELSRGDFIYEHWSQPHTSCHLVVVGLGTKDVRVVYGRMQYLLPIDCYDIELVLTRLKPTAGPDLFYWPEAVAA